MSDAATTTFHRLRPRLIGIAYRMLSSMAEAEDVVQDAWLRWHGTDPATLDSAEAWLVTVTTRIAIDRLRAAKLQRAHYTGNWLPEPVLTEGPATPEQLQELADDVSVAFLVLLDHLAPEARAAFVLREVLDADYAQVAQALGKNAAACRQIVSRAKAQLRAAQPHAHPHVPRETHHQLLRGFAEALSRGDFQAMHAMLATDAALISDGGGIVSSFGKPLVGARRIAQLFFAAHRKHGEMLRIQLVVLNGEWALLRFIDGRLESAQCYETDGERITRIHVQRNPHKLARLGTVAATTA